MPKISASATTQMLAENTAITDLSKPNAAGVAGVLHEPARREGVKMVDGAIEVALDAAVKITKG